MNRKLLLFVHSDTRHFHTAIFLLHVSCFLKLLFVVMDFKRKSRTSEAVVFGGSGGAVGGAGGGAGAEAGVAKR